MAVVLFYWLMFCLSLWAWFKTITCLCKCQFIRSAIWWNIAVALLLWWTDKWESWDTFWPGAVFFVGVSVLGTLVRTLVRYQKRKAMLATPTWTTPADAEIELVVPAQQILELDKSEYRSIQ